MKLSLAFAILAAMATTALACSPEDCAGCTRRKPCNRQDGCTWSGGECVEDAPEPPTDPFPSWPPAGCSVPPDGCCCEGWDSGDPTCPPDYDWSYWGGDEDPPPNDNADWADLDPNTERPYLETLGWLPSLWDSCYPGDWPDSEFTCFESLTVEEKDAVFNLGYGPYSWNDCSDLAAP